MGDNNASFSHDESQQPSGLNSQRLLEKALFLVETGRVVKIDMDNYYVYSMHPKAIPYEKRGYVVKHDGDGTWMCSCGHFKHRKKTGKRPFCSHTIACLMAESKRKTAEFHATPIQLKL